MKEPKTRETNASVEEFLDSVKDTYSREDSINLKRIFDETTGLEAKMWGENIIGYGKYRQTYVNSKREIEWMLIGFSPRKQNISIYIMPGFQDYDNILSRLGKFKVSKSVCLYIKKLSDINVVVLKELIIKSIEDMKKKHGI